MERIMMKNKIRPFMIWLMVVVCSVAFLFLSCENEIVDTEVVIVSKELITNDEELVPVYTYKDNGTMQPMYFEPKSVDPYLLITYKGRNKKGEEVTAKTKMSPSLFNNFSIGDTISIEKVK